jgi:hypothetical protein
MGFDFGSSSAQQQQQVANGTGSSSRGSSSRGSSSYAAGPKFGFINTSSSAVNAPAAAVGSNSSSNAPPSAAAAAAAAEEPPEEFPALSASAAAPALDPTPAAAAAGRQPGSSSSSTLQPPQQQQQQLVKATAKCPCGRRQLHTAVRVGESPAPLKCDKECEKQQRKQTLASAFGVEDADKHAAYWDKHRTPTYSPQLLQVGAMKLSWSSAVFCQLSFQLNVLN